VLKRAESGKQVGLEMKYRMYIDEVGNPDLGSSDDPNHRFLSLTGAVLELGYVERVLHPPMEALKAKFFSSHPDDPVIFHRKEMLNAKPPFERLRDRSVRQEFDEELLALLDAWHYTVPLLPCRAHGAFRFLPGEGELPR
jgi:hypothetical protein